MRLVGADDAEMMALLFGPIEWSVVSIDLEDHRRRVLVVEFDGNDDGAEGRIRSALAGLVGSG